MTRNMSLTPEIEVFITGRIASGRFRNASQVVRAALRLLRRTSAGGRRPLHPVRPKLARVDSRSVLAGHDVLANGGEMGALMRAHDWAATPVGPPATWSQALRTTVRLLLTSRHPMFIFWGEAHTCFYNDAYRSTMGPERHPGALGQPGRQVWDEIWPIIGPQIEQVMTGGEATWHEDQLVPVTRHGQRQDVWWTYGHSPINDPAAPGGIGGVLVVCNDVTREHLGREHLREAEARLRELNCTLEQQIERRTRERDRTWRLSQDLLVVADTDGTLLAVNAAWTALLDWDSQDLVGIRFVALTHPDDLDATLASFASIFEAPLTRPYEYRLQHKDGTYRWFAWTGAFEDGKVYANGRHTTSEREQALALAASEEQLHQSQKMEAVGQLTGGIAHDFNNMLQAIGSSLDMLQRRMAQGRVADADCYAQSARKTVERAAALTHRLLAFARRQTLQPRPVKPDELVRGMADLIRQTAGPSATVGLDLGDGAWGVLCDPGQLENVLLNLAVNARDAMPDGGRLTLSTRNVFLCPADLVGQDGTAPGDHVEIAVADTGTGMDEATRARAFEPFFTTKPIGQGTGLGLSQAYGFVRQSGGVVRLDSASGRGTTVRLYLPRHRAAGNTGQDGPGAAADAPQAAAGEVLLLVEDEADVRTAAADHLRDLGYRVLEAGDGPTALRLLREAPRVDLLVSDVGLSGGLNGRQVAEAAREHRPGLPVLFITGYVGPPLDGQLAPDMAVLGKPFALDALAAKAQAMLETAPAT